MRKRRTKAAVKQMPTITYKGPLGERVFHKIQDAVRFLQGARGSSAHRDSVPWRDALKDTIAQGGEAAAALRGARTTAGLSQLELAAKLGIDQANLSKMENGKRPIGKDMAKRFGEVLNVDYRIFL